MKSHSLLPIGPVSFSESPRPAFLIEGFSLKTLTLYLCSSQEMSFIESSSPSLYFIIDLEVSLS